MSGSRVGDDDVLVVAVVVDDALDAGPGVLDVVEVAPQVAAVDDGAEVGLHPGVDLVDGPAAGVHHGAPRLVEVVPELGVSAVHVARVGVAAVELHVVDVPGGEGLGVGAEVAQDAGVAGAGVVPVVLVDAEFEPFGVHLSGG